MTTATILPPGETTFFDNNGVPLAGGLVYFYIPSTTTPKTTWQDSAEGTPNPNPVVLDSAGRGLIYGSGAYRQVVKDSLGNTIWDQATADLSATVITGVSAGTGISVSTSGGVATITNSGVVSATGSTNLSVSASSGAVTFSLAHTLDWSSFGSAHNFAIWAVGDYISFVDASSAVKSLLTAGASTSFCAIIGDVTSGVNVTQNDLLPASDNANSLGSNAVGWGDVFSHHYTTLSDASLKTSLAPLPDDVLDIITEIQPRTFKFIEGGRDIVKDAAGNPVMNGQFAQTSSRAGKRTHWGFIAQDFEKAMLSRGLDFGGWLEGADGLQRLRSAQQIPILWAGVQKLISRISALEGKSS